MVGILGEVWKVREVVMVEEAVMEEDAAAIMEEEAQKDAIMVEEKKVMVKIHGDSASHRLIPGYEKADRGDQPFEIMFASERWSKTACAALEFCILNSCRFATTSCQ